MPFYDRLLSATVREQEHFLAIPILQRALTGNITRHHYLTFLEQAYHHVKHTVPLLMGCGYRLPEHYAWLREAVSLYISEESGHEQWILDDIGASGGDTLAARSATPFAATELMVAYAYDVIHRQNPVGYFGMVLVLEGTSVAIASRAAAFIKQSLNLPDGAFHYLNSHGALDLSHMRFFKELMDRITDAADQNFVIHCANMFYRLYGNIFRAISEH